MVYGYIFDSKVSPPWHTFLEPIATPNVACNYTIKQK